VITVASASTHPGIGPAHLLYGLPTDPHQHEVKEYHADVKSAKEDAANAAAVATGANNGRSGEGGIITDVLEDLGLSGIKFTLTSSGSAPLVGAAGEEVKESAVKLAVKDVQSAVSGILSTNSSTSSSDSQSEETDSELTSRALNEDEKHGLYVLGGLVGGGLLLSKLFA
jgi:hypothetical protein